MPRRAGMTFVSAGVQGAGSRPGDEVATKAGQVALPRSQPAWTNPRPRSGRAKYVDGSGEGRASARNERQGI